MAQLLLYFTNQGARKLWKLLGMYIDSNTNVNKNYKTMQSGVATSSSTEGHWCFAVALCRIGAVEFNYMARAPGDEAMFLGEFCCSFPGWEKMGHNLCGGLL
jgi:hypothetical protein